MSDIRTRLVTALKEHERWLTGHLPMPHEVLADVLLSLPGIAITELPEPDEILKNRAVFHAAPYRVVSVTGGVDQGFVDLNNTHLLYRNARTLAAALLAAANAAQETP